MSRTNVLSVLVGKSPYELHERTLWSQLGLFRLQYKRRAPTASARPAIRHGLHKIAEIENGHAEQRGIVRLGLGSAGTVAR